MKKGGLIMSSTAVHSQEFVLPVSNRTRCVGNTTVVSLPSLFVTIFDCSCIESPTSLGHVDLDKKEKSTNN